MKTKDLIDRINTVSYGRKLQVVNIIKSVNCKEWEDEKKIFGGHLLRKRNPMATRYYVKIKNRSDKICSEYIHDGHIDIRPNSMSISDAFLPIPNKDNFYVTCQKNYKSDIPFDKTIQTVPYITPIEILSRCSPASMWIILTTLSNEFSKEYLSLADINRFLPPKAIASDVSIEHYSKLCQELNYSPHYYLGKKKKDFLDESEDKLSQCDNCILCDFYWDYIERHEEVKEAVMDSDILYAYIESEIPVYLVFKWNDLREIYNFGTSSEEFHTVVAIGHTLDGDGCFSSFIVHDVSYAPFVEIPKQMIDENLIEAFVLLPKDVVRCENIEEDTLLNIIEMYRNLSNDLFNDGAKLIFRPFLMRSQRIKFWYTNKALYNQKEMRNMYSKADFPRYVWVLEVGTPESKKKNKCLGQIIFDASISTDSMGPVLINLPKFRYWHQNKKIKKEHLEVPSFESLALFRSSCNERHT